jgi:hypothetical protein
MKFRIVKNDLGHYPQVKKGFLWKRIAKHPTGFGLYPKDSYDYPKTEAECEKMIEDYVSFCLLSKKMVVVKKSSYGIQK